MIVTMVHVGENEDLNQGSSNGWEEKKNGQYVIQG